jgi:hypothetical protein
MTDLAQVPVVAGGTTYQITGANLSSYFNTNAGNITSTTDVNITIDTPDSSTFNWQFGADGSLTLPIGVSIDNNVGPLYPKIIADSDLLFSVQGQGNTGSAALAWTVDPNAASQYAAVAVSRGGGDNLAKVVLQAQSNSGDVGTAKTWRFDETGTLTAPGQITAPSLITNSIRSDDSSFVNIEDGVNITGAVVASGNIAGNYFIGNGSQLTGISAGANIGNVTFNDQIVLGTGTNDGGGGLYLAPGNASIANSAVQYFRVRGGDVPTHIHLDTGNNDYYDQYFGDDAQYVKLANIGNVVIGAANVSSSAQWSFDPNGTLVVPAANGVPGQISTATTQASEKGFDLRITAGNTGGCSVSGGDVYLSAGVGYNGVSHGGGNVSIVTGDRYGNIVGNIWNFGSTGALTLPLGGVKIKDTVGNSVAFGLNAGFSLQGIEAVAIGSYAGNNRQGNNSVAIGNTAGAGGSVSTNYVSGAESPSTTLVVVSTTGIGPGMIISGTGFFGNITVVTVTNSTTLEISASAGFTPSGTLTFTGNQGANAVAIGQGAGSTNQGTGAVAIGARAGLTNQGNNSIILNATGANLDQTTANTFTVAPVRNDVANIGNVMFYNATSKEITYGNVISVAGNITGGNLLTGGLISATGNVSGGNILGGANVNATTHTGITVSVTANITGGNILTGGLISATGNVSGGNIITAAAISAASVSASGNITGGNIQGSNLRTAGLVSATGNVTGGNLNVAGNIVNVTGALSIITGSNGNIALAPNGTGIVTASGAFSTVGNITGGNVLGGANVNATTHTGTTVSVSANITGGNVTTAGLTSTASLSITGNTATVTSANYSIGYLTIPQVTLSANSTAALTDSGKHFYSTTAGNLEITIPDNANVAFPVGTAISIVVQAAGNVLVVTQPSTTLYLGGNATSGNRVVGTYGMATVLKVATNTWFISGTGVS